MHSPITDFLQLRTPSININLQSRVRTWELLQSVDDLLPSWLHAHQILTHHQSKHHQGNDLADVRLWRCPVK